MLHTIYADGGARPNPGRGGCGVVVLRGEEVIESAGKYLGEQVTNNAAEYRGLIFGLSLVLKYRPSTLRVRMDSKLVIQQMLGKWRVNHVPLQKLNAAANSLVQSLVDLGLQAVYFEHIPRELNGAADKLATRAILKKMEHPGGLK